MAEAFCHREELAVGADLHHGLGDAEGDHLRVGEHPLGVICLARQEIVGEAENSNQQQVEVGEHRGPLGSTVRYGTADFDLAAFNPYAGVGAVRINHLGGDGESAPGWTEASVGIGADA